MSTRAARTEKLDLRLSPNAKRRLEAAARVSSRTVSGFVLESALSRADDTLADRRHFVLTKPKWKAFVAALDAPTRPLPRLQRLFTEPDFFDAAPLPGSTTPKR
jgi:uncharacterized protein (DUF1778 family)